MVDSTEARTLDARAADAVASCCSAALPSIPQDSPAPGTKIMRSQAISKKKQGVPK